jgi:translation initiation factor 1
VFTRFCGLLTPFLFGRSIPAYLADRYHSGVEGPISWPFNPALHPRPRPVEPFTRIQISLEPTASYLSSSSQQHLHMAKKKKKKDQGFDFSTGDGRVNDNPFAALSGLGAQLPEGPDQSLLDDAVEKEEPDRSTQILRVFLDRKHRGGKEATIVRGYVGDEEELKELGKHLKAKCGVGGSVKNGEVIIQGNKRDQVVSLLLGMGYRNTKKSGG